jgi:hypothetical protein
MLRTNAAAWMDLGRRDTPSTTIDTAGRKKKEENLGERSAKSFRPGEGSADCLKELLWHSLAQLNTLIIRYSKTFQGIRYMQKLEIHVSVQANMM